MMETKNTEHRLLAISLRTLDWTEGDHVWFDARLAPEATIIVEWGDGKHSTLRPDLHGCSRVEHYYKCKGQQYQIEFLSDEPESILELVDGTWETRVDHVFIENCPSLRLLQYCGVAKFDLSGCANLEALDCESYGGEALDLSSLKNLQMLRLHSVKNMTAINLNQNPKLEVLDLGFSKIKKVAIPNNSNLKQLCWEETYLDKHSREWFQKVIEKNNVEVVDFISEFIMSIGVFRGKL